MAKTISRGRNLPARCGSRPVKNNGLRPYITKLPNEPTPLDKYQQEGLFTYHPELGSPSDQNAYINEYGDTLAKAVHSWWVVGSYGKDRDEFGTHKYRSKESMLNAVRRLKADVLETEDGSIVLVLSNDWNPDRGWKQHSDRYHEHDNLFNQWKAWKAGDVYDVRFINDPTVEGVSDPIYPENPRYIPKNNVVRHEKVFTSNPEKYIEKERQQHAEMESRTYRVHYPSDPVVTHREAIALGFSGKDMRIGQKEQIKYNMPEFTRNSNARPNNGIRTSRPIQRGGRRGRR